MVFTALWSSAEPWLEKISMFTVEERKQISHSHIKSGAVLECVALICSLLSIETLLFPEEGIAFDTKDLFPGFVQSLITFLVVRPPSGRSSMSRNSLPLPSHNERSPSKTSPGGSSGSSPKSVTELQDVRRDEGRTIRSSSSDCHFEFHRSSIMFGTSMSAHRILGR